jgi:hypothetical protein
MKVKLILSGVALLAAVSLLNAASPPPGVTGSYLEVRSCDVYTGPCFANAEMGLTGREALLVWSVRDGAWNGTSLAGLSVIAALRTDDTLGDLKYHPRQGRAVLIVDAKATPAQQAALADFARTMGGKLLHEVVAVKTASLDVTIGGCTQSGCASVKAAGLVEISTRCLGDKDHLCGNEENYYPPLTKVDHARAAFTEVASYQGDGLGVKWQGTSQRNAFLGTFDSAAPSLTVASK